MRDYRNSKHYYVMAKVLASMKQLSYNVQVTLSVKSGFVVDAYCHCHSLAWLQRRAACSLSNRTLIARRHRLSGNGTQNG